MDEGLLLKISLIGALAGIVSIYISVALISVAPIDIGEINSGMIGQSVNITGFVSELFHHEDGHIFFDLQDNTGSIKVVIWSSDAESLEPISDGDRLNMIGTVELYKGDLEVIPLRKQVKLLN